MREIRPTLLCPMISCSYLMLMRQSWKGGVGKLTLARAIAVEFVNNGWDVHVADMDKSQRTTTYWAETRKEQGVKPEIEIGGYTNAKTALKRSKICGLLVIDGAAYADTNTMEVAEQSDLIVIPTGVTADDLRASLALGQEMTMNGVKKEQLFYVVIKVPENGDKEAMATRKSINDWGFKVAKGWIPFKTSFGKAMDMGRTMCETRHNSLNEKSDQIIQAIVDYAMALESKKSLETAE